MEVLIGSVLENNHGLGGRLRCSSQTALVMLLGLSGSFVHGPSELWLPGNPRLGIVMQNCIEELLKSGP